MQQRHGLVDELLDWKALAGARAEGGRISGFKSPSVECGWHRAHGGGRYATAVVCEFASVAAARSAWHSLDVRGLLPNKLNERGHVVRNVELLEVETVTGARGAHLDLYFDRRGFFQPFTIALVRRGDRIYQMTMQVITDRQPDRAAAGLYVQDLLPKLVDRGEA